MIWFFYSNNNFKFFICFNFKKISIGLTYDEPNNIKIHKKTVSCFGGFIFAANIILLTAYSYLISESNFIKNELFISKRSFFLFYYFFIIFYVWYI